MSSVFEYSFFYLLVLFIFLYKITCKIVYAFQCSENVKDFLDTLILTQKEAIEAGEEEATLMTDTHLVQTVMDLFDGKKK